MPREYSIEERIWLVEVAYEALVTVLEERHVLTGDEIKNRILQIIESQGGEDGQEADNSQPSEMPEVPTGS